MKEIVVISGKGGTGKTSVTASLAYFGGKDIVVADCDVDAADLHLLLDPVTKEKSDFYSGWEAEINNDKCTGCDLCRQKCRFSAINIINKKYIVDSFDCEGCSYCSKLCEYDAIKMLEKKSGELYISSSRFGSDFIHAKLGIGSDNSGKLVAKVKDEAKKMAARTGIDFILIDGSPGVGCPVISSLSGADYVLLVAEPTKSGYHDLKRVVKLIKRFNIKAGLIINKADLNNKISDKIHDFCIDNNIDHMENIYYTDTFSKAMVRNITAAEFDNKIAEKIKNVWVKISKIKKKKNENSIYQ